MNDDIDTFLGDIRSLCDSTDVVLNEWNGEGNLQFPVLLGMMAVKLNWDEEQVRKNDPFIRAYVRQHSGWHVTRGAHGGIMRASEKQKKEAAVLAKDLAKKQVQAAIAAKTEAVLAAKSDTSDSE